MSFTEFGDELHKQAQHLGYRYCVVVSGEENWSWSTAQEICRSFGSEHVYTISSRGNLPDTGALTHIIAPGKARQFLGTETAAVVVDCHGDFAPDAVGILSGTIRAGGFLVLITPPVDAWAGERSETGTAPEPKSAQATSLYVTRLCRILGESDQVVRIEQNGAKPCLPAIPQLAPGPICFDDQERAVAAVKRVISGQRRKPVVLLSDRGRGKSAALGLAARELLQSGLDNIIVTGAGKASVATVFKHADVGIEGASANLQYWPPDKLVREKPETGMLLIDEAASIALPMLESLLQSYPRIAFASTVHGYEGTGRGFILRFKGILDRHCRGWKTCELHSPVRWASGDPLESLVLDLLLMNAEIEECQSSPGPAENTVFEVIGKQRVCDDEPLLREIFALLTQAHYRTRPADLLHLLDGDNLEMVRLHHDNETLAVALVAAEGGMHPDCSLPVWMNRRRPQNSLLPEILCAQLGFIEAMHLKIARIVRIVVKPQYQRGGLGSQLLGHISDHYGNRVDLLGTAFSVSPGLLGFWLRNDYRVARTGVGKSRNTGSHSCVLIQGISGPGKELQEKVETKMLRNLPFQLTDTLRSLHPEIVMQIYATCLKPDMQPEIQPELDYADLQDLVAVGYAGRSLADAISPLVKLARLAIASDAPCLDKQQQEFLVERFLQQKSWGECMALPPPRGKKPGSDLCRDIVTRILTSEYQSRVQPIMKEFQLNGEDEPCSG